MTTMGFTHSPLIGLPPEIRMQILKFVVVTDKKIEIKHQPARGLTPSNTRSGKHLPPTDHNSHTTSLLALAFTSRQLYLECTPFYYSLNTFHYTDTSDTLPSPLTCFITAIGVLNVRAITLFSIKYCLRSSNVKLASLAASPKQLKVLEVEIKSHVMKDCVPGDLRTFVKGKEGLLVQLVRRRSGCSYCLEILMEFVRTTNEENRSLGEELKGERGKA